MKRAKRAISILMCAALLFCLLPTAALAEGGSVTFRVCGISDDLDNNTDILTYGDNGSLNRSLKKSNFSKADTPDDGGAWWYTATVSGITTSSITFQIVVPEGKKLDTVRGVEFDGQELTPTDGIYTVVLSDNNEHQVSFGFGYEDSGNLDDGDEGENQPPASVNPGKLSFVCQNNAVTGGSIYYKLNNTGDFVKVSEENNQYNSIALTEATSIAIKFVANEDYQLDTTRGVTLRVNGTDKFSSTNDNIAAFTSESGHTFNLSELVGESSVSESSFELEFGFENAGGEPEPGPEPGPGDEPAHGGYEGEQKTASITVTGQADFYINDSRMVNNSTSGTYEVKYTYAGNNTVDFYFDCFINQRITELKVNDVDYYGKLPNPSTEEGKAALLAACKGQLNEFKITVPYSESGYTVVSSVKDLDETDANYMVVGNFLWTYKDQNQGDDYMDNGRMELLSVTYKDEPYNPEPSTGMGWDQDNDGGSAVLPVGAVVTVKLVPDYGYQLTSFGINGGSFGTGDEQSTFTFEIKPGNAHLGAHFTSVEDTVSSTAAAVTEGTIQLGENEIDTGSVVLSVGNAPEGVNENGFQTAIAENEGTGGYEIASVLDINLNQVIYKGTEDPTNVWSNEMTELKSNAEISLKLDGDYTDAVVVHEKHDGSYEVISTAYAPETNTLTFGTKSFSNYAVAVAPEVVPDNTPSTPSTPSNSTTTTTPSQPTTSTETKPDGSTTTTTTNKTTGAVTETTKTPDGTTGTVVTDKNGNVTEVKSTVSTAAAKEAGKTGGAVTLPVEVPAAKTTEAAPAVEVTVPKSAGSVKVEVPVEKVTPGTVAVIVQADGTEKIVSTSVVTENGVALKLDGSATVKIFDNAKSFTDVPATNVFYNEIASLSAREIMIGKAGDKFDLHSTVTLDQIANVAGRITGAVDVKDFGAGVAWGKNGGLKTGNVSATRGDVLKALYVAAGSPTVEDTSILAKFKDASGIPADMAAIAAWAAQNGILKGNMDGTAGLSANVTRGQACALAGRTMGTLA